MADPVVTGTGVALPGARCAADLLALTYGSARPVPEPWPSRDRDTRFKDRATRLALMAGEAALTAAGLLDAGGPTVPGEEVGVIVSSNLGTLDTVCRVTETLDRDGPAALRVVNLPNACSNATASSVAIRFALHGINLTLCNGATSGLDALGWAALALATARARRLLVIGVEPAGPAARHCAGASGTLDGAAALVLESADAAAGRGRATLTGYARRTNADAAIAAAAAAAGPAGRATGCGLWLPPQEGAIGVGAVCHPDTPEDRAARAARAPRPGFDPGRRDRDTEGDSHHPDGIGYATVCDLGRALPPASGAFGVLQCVAATAWITAGTPAGVPPTALAVAGGGRADDAAAALLLSAAHHAGAPDEGEE
ncbi:beta-ketoacyl synthase N-terminal-like domain-containing protein [Streptomyces cinnamoneus]|uniref:Beta-ketoacyl synthase-like N-terminal domain-containing protein n=1 Tax=Streptomyces cinnamoneus TaxID=53446 RepID=A0A918WEU9_STRCJ|nr:beta-ketoacyl synthase N-terminal-like domain-containing protein [Streptomyces cinnamoneus]GHC40245.1 hypothetical protein GCM10010507_12970 [Streptomyces cinnamoneus]